jgi:hypothetical protein
MLNDLCFADRSRTSDQWDCMVDVKIFVHHRFSAKRICLPTLSKFQNAARPKLASFQPFDASPHYCNVAPKVAPMKKRLKGAFPRTI